MNYEAERIKAISAWSMFGDDDLPVRPNATDALEGCRRNPAPKNAR
jgi:hypothetical protein